MPEHQTIEYKESWQDEFLEWICGYANAYGGILYIGKMITEMLLDSAIKTERNCWNPFQIKSQIQ